MSDQTLLDCGHAPSEHSEHTTGYGSDSDGRKYCYECCAERERAAMIETGCSTLYFCENVEHGGTIPRFRNELTDWPGKLRFHVWYVNRSHGYGFGRRYPIVTGRFNGPDGFVWSFRNAGDMQIARCRRTKERVQS